MNLRSPLAAMLWENWRLTRVEAAQRLGLGLVAGSAALTLFNAGAVGAFWILLLVHGMFWLSMAKLNGGRFLDGYKPGFPLYLLYTRPVSTVVFVGVAVAYDAISCTALYLVSAALLGIVFGQPLPLLSVALWIVTFHIVCIAFQWSTRNRVIQYLGTFLICAPMFFQLKGRVTSPLQIEFSLAENAVMALICLVTFGLTVAGVARQRHGGAVANASQKVVTGAYPDWLVSLLRFSCPTSSAMKAQMWFELRTSGLPVLAIGLGLAILIPLLFAISVPVVYVRPFALLSVMISVPTVLFFAGNAFGIRRKQGRTYVSAFESTQPNGTAELAGLKVLLRSACMLVALIVVGVSVWSSSLLLNAWGPWWVDGKDASQEFLKLRSEIGATFFGGLTGYALAAQAAVVSIAVAITVATFAVLAALRARYPRQLLVAGALLLLYGLTLVLLAMLDSEVLLDSFVRSTWWIAVAAPVFATAYLFWSGFAERALTIRYVCGALVISAAFGVACLPGDAVSILSTVLLTLMVCVLAPWSLNRIRHL